MAAPMEASTLTFTMVVWLMMGWRFEEIQTTEPMGAEQCLELLFAIETDRSPAFQSGRAPAKGECVGSDGRLRLPRTRRESPRICDFPLPGRRRV
jgi:hypothetical protein